jgi:acyl-CoA thioester hydrolase
MPMIYERTFRVRHHECDIHRIVRDACYFRYMQEAAFDASTAAGYGQRRYVAMGMLWLIRETDVEFLIPLRFGDSVRVKTWVGDFRRVQSRRMYELRNDATGELVAHAHTDWAFLDRATGRPAVIPDELISAFFPEGAPSETFPRRRFPDAPPPPPGAFTLRRRVEWRDLDAVGHVNNAAYADFVENIARQAAAACGWPAAAMAAAGFDLATRQISIDYRHPALPEDELEILTWLSDVSDESAVRHTSITRVADGELLARARSVWGCVSFDVRRPCALPQGLVEGLRAQCAE